MKPSGPSALLPIGLYPTLTGIQSYPLLQDLKLILATANLTLFSKKLFTWLGTPSRRLNQLLTFSGKPISISLSKMALYPKG